MKLNKKHLAVGIALSASLVISACGGSAGDAAVSGGNSSMISNDFVFPEVSNVAEGEGIAAPAGAAPEFSARRTLSTGSGEPIEFGEPVVVQYDMYSWSTGALVDSTSNYEEPLTVSAGVTNGVPDYLSKSLLGRQIGDKLQVVFQRDMEDLPSYLDGEDAYVLIVTLL